MKNKLFPLLMPVIFVVVFSTAQALSVNFIKRGFKSCTETCSDQSICPLENDEVFKWCLKNCSYKINIKDLCEASMPFKLRPILPYESSYKGAFNTNQVSIMALENLDRHFIEQTTDRRRVVGTAKLVLLVRAQLLQGINVQKLNESQRDLLGEKLLKEYFKGAPSVGDPNQKISIIPDDRLHVLFKEVKGEILAKIR